MDFSFNDSSTAVRDLARGLFLRSRGPSFATLAETGLLGVAVPEAFGGSGQGLIELFVLLREAGSAALSVPLVETLCATAMSIARFGSDDQRRRYLSPWCRGEHVLTAALTEGGHGDFAAPRTSALRRGDSWVLSGRKVIVALADVAHRVLVSAKTADGAIGLFLLDPRASGVTLTPQVITTGETRFDVHLEWAPVADDDVLVAPTVAASRKGAADWVSGCATLGLCALQLGGVERVLQMTAEYISTRVQFDRPIATFQAAAHRATNARIDVDAIRLSLWQAAWRFAEERGAAAEIAMAKFWSADAGYRVVCAAQHLHAGIGFDLEYPLHRYYLQAKLNELMLGGASEQLRHIGAQLAEA